MDAAKKNCRVTRQIYLLNSWEILATLFQKTCTNLHLPQETGWEWFLKEKWHDQICILETCPASCLGLVRWGFGSPGVDGRGLVKTRGKVLLSRLSHQTTRIEARSILTLKSPWIYHEVEGSLEQYSPLYHNCDITQCLLDLVGNYCSIWGPLRISIHIKLHCAEMPSTWISEYQEAYK